MLEANPLATVLNLGIVLCSLIHRSFLRVLSPRQVYTPVAKAV